MRFPVRSTLLALGLVLVCTGLVACPHPPPPTPHPTPDAQLDAAPAPMLDASMPGIPACPASVTETPDDVCDSLFTADNHACVVCTGGAGCIDHSVEVYCTQGPCALDPACRRVSDPSTGGGADSTKKRLRATRPVPACPKTVTETPEGVCAALFTKDNHACVRCTGGHGCIDHSVEVYCITTPTCAADLACHHVAGK